LQALNQPGQSNDFTHDIGVALDAMSQPQNQPGQTNNGQSAQVWENFFGSEQALAFLSHDPGSGLSLVQADDALRDQLMLPKGQGLVVMAVDGSSPAAHAGIQQNDVLLNLGETPLAKPEDLERSLKKAGDDQVLLVLVRGGSQLKFPVQPRYRITLGPAQPKPAEHEYWIGVSVSAIEPALRSQLKIPMEQGLIVNAVVNDSPAGKAGIKVHDILLSLDQKLLSDPHKLAEAVQANGEIPIVLELIRAGQRKGPVSVTPARRKTTTVAAQGNQAKFYYFLRPGAVLAETIPAQGQPANQGYSSVGNLWPDDSMWLQYPTTPKAAEDANAALVKKLDALDAEIKQLRKAVADLSKTEKIVEDLNKLVEALNKASKEKK